MPQAKETKSSDSEPRSCCKRELILDDCGADLPGSSASKKSARAPEAKRSHAQQPAAESGVDDESARNQGNELAASAAAGGDEEVTFSR